LSLLTVMMNNDSMEVELYEKIVGDLGYDFFLQTEVSSQLPNVPSPSVETDRQTTSCQKVTQLNSRPKMYKMKHFTDILKLTNDHAKQKPPNQYRDQHKILIFSSLV